MKSVLSLFAAVILTLGVAPPAAAQSYPHKLVRFIVSVFPGSPIGVLARLLASPVGLRFDDLYFDDSSSSICRGFPDSELPR